MSRIVGGGQLVEQFVGRLRRADLARVDARADGDDGPRAGRMASASRSLASRRGSASRRLSICSVSRFRMFSGALMMRGDDAAGPRWSGPVDQLTRSEAVSTARKYFSIDGQSASLPSVPIRKPKNASGDGHLRRGGERNARPARDDGRTQKRMRHTMAVACQGLLASAVWRAGPTVAPEVRVGVVVEGLDVRVGLERGLHDAAQHARAAAVDDPDLPEPGVPRGRDVVLDDRRARRAGGTRGGRACRRWAATCTG